MGGEPVGGEGADEGLEDILDGIDPDDTRTWTVAQKACHAAGWAFGTAQWTRVQEAVQAARDGQK